MAINRDANGKANEIFTKAVFYSRWSENKIKQGMSGNESFGNATIMKHNYSFCEMKLIITQP